MTFYLQTLDGKKRRVGPRDTLIPCFRCGLCCTNTLVKLTSHELKIIGRYLGVSHHELLNKYVKKTPIGYLIRQTGNKCVFLEYNGRGTIATCRIYASRPEACRNWVPSLSCPQCQEGLRKLGRTTELLLPKQIYQSKDETIKLYSAIKDDSSI